MKLFSSVALILFLPLTILSRDIYIVYDENCMDRLEYSYDTEDGESTYAVYHINISTSEKIILEVGKENQNEQRYVPSNFWRCDNTNFGLELIQSVNQNSDNIFLVQKRGKRKYTISRVRIASYYKLENEIVQYFSPKYKFEFDLQAGTIGENIAFENPRAEVYFEGRLDNECSGAYIFRQYSEAKNSPPHTDIVLVPEIGITEERSGLNVEDAFNNLLSLNRVNDKSLAVHLNRLCGDGTMTEDIVLEETDDPAVNEGTTNTQQPDESDFTERSPGTVVSGGEPTADQHIVRKGETLYKISRKYDVSVAQLQSWNELSNSSVIYPGDRLWVSSPELVALNERGGDSNPAPYDRNDTRRQYDPENDQADNYHLVRVGETVASIAMKYGYTEEKFREINDMNSRDIVRIGQRVKTSDCDCPSTSTSDRSVSHPESQPTGYQYFRERDTQGATRFNYVNPRQATETPVNKNIPTFYDAPAERRFQEAEEQQRGAKPYYEAVDTPQSYGDVSISYEIDAPNSRQVHTVRDGESIYSVARKYKMTVERLRELNNLERNEVVIPYQRLYVE